LTDHSPKRKLKSHSLVPQLQSLRLNNAKAKLACKTNPLV